MVKIRITQAKSTIGAKQNMKDTLHILELRKISQSVARGSIDIVPSTVHTVCYLVTVEKVD